MSFCRFDHIVQPSGHCRRGHVPDSAPVSVADLINPYADDVHVETWAGDRLIRCYCAIGRDHTRSEADQGLGGSHP